jgi:hypothetical protein
MNIKLDGFLAAVDRRRQEAMPTPKIPLKDGSEYALPWKLRLELGELYYDVDEELEAMRLWCLANPARRKTPSGAFRFITSWLARTGKRRQTSASLSVIRAQEPITDEQRDRNKGHIENLKAMLKRRGTV